MTIEGKDGFSREPANRLQEIAAQLAQDGAKALMADGHAQGSTVAIVTTPQSFRAPDVASTGINKDGLLLIFARVYCSMAIETKRDPIEFVRALLTGRVTTDDEAFADDDDADEAPSEDDDALDDNTEAFFQASVREANALLQQLHAEGKSVTREIALGFILAAIGHFKQNDVTVEDAHNLLVAGWALTDSAIEQRPLASPEAAT
jgi:ATP-dependent Clp protease adapter protein ClpS